MCGAQCLKHGATTQPTIAFSCGEAELTGICHSAGEALGLQAILKDLGFNLPVRVHSDAAAAIGICRRRGLGRVRHLAVANLWVQDRLRTGDFELHKIAGSLNPADILTKHVDWGLLKRHLNSFQFEFEEGRAELAAHI